MVTTIFTLLALAPSMVALIATVIAILVTSTPVDAPAENDGWAESLLAELDTPCYPRKRHYHARVSHRYAPQHTYVVPVVHTFSYAQLYAASCRRMGYPLPYVGCSHVRYD